MTTQSRKHRGYRSQKVFAEYVRDIFPHAEPTGAGRQGRDILGTSPVWFELKARTGFDPKSALRQAHQESAKDVEKLGDVAPDWPVAVLRMNGQGEANIGEWVAVMRVDTLKELLKEAGYGTD